MEAKPKRVQYRVGLGVTVSLLLASAVGLVAWASFTNTHKAILELTNEQVRELLTALDLRVRDRHVLCGYSGAPSGQVE